MTIYVDILFALNLIVSFYLLLFTARLGGEKPGFLRLFFASFFAAGAAFCIFLPDFGFFFSLFLRLIISGTVALICFGIGTPKRYFRLFATFFITTFAFAGLMLALWHLLGIQSMVIRNGIVYYDLSPILLIASTTAAYLILTLIRRLMRRNSGQAGAVYPVVIGFLGAEAKFQALLDTGNALTDPFSESPVIVAEFPLIEQLLPEGAREVYAAGDTGSVPKGMERCHRLIPFTSVGGRGVLPGFMPDYTEIPAEGFGRTYRAVVAVSAEALGGEHRALIGGALLEACSGQKGRLDYKPENAPKNIPEKMKLTK